VDDAYLGGERCGWQAWSWIGEARCQVVGSRLLSMRRGHPPVNNKLATVAHVLFCPLLLIGPKISTGE